jgi:YD repeat-containing protein
VNRRTKVTGGVTTTYSYDRANELTTEEEGAAVTTYMYDENGNTLAWNASGSRTTLTCSYEDELLALLTAGGALATMTYDAAGRQAITIEATFATPRTC